MARSLLAALVVVVVALCARACVAQRGRWSESEAAAWYAGLPWLVGCNFIPSTAGNQLEMWQAASFDVAALERELDAARALGFTSNRVYLHHLLYQQDPQGLIARMEQFLAMAAARGMGTMFVHFDGCWNPQAALGEQPAPTPHVHNSVWVQSPGKDILEDEARHDEMEPYVYEIIAHFRNDSRIHAWDLFNEPSNPNAFSYFRNDTRNKAARALALLEKAFTWARAAEPTQPLTSGVYTGRWGNEDLLTPLARFQLDASDVITFHSYGPVDTVQQRVGWLRRYNRPILCTEYMARTAGSTFETVMPYLRSEGVAAYNWGLVAGKTQTIYSWTSWIRAPTEEPDVWFHDIFRPDLTPYNATEISIILANTGGRKAGGNGKERA